MATPDPRTIYHPLQCRHLEGTHLTLILTQVRQVLLQVLNNVTNRVSIQLMNLPLRQPPRLRRIEPIQLRRRKLLLERIFLRLVSPLLTLTLQPLHLRSVLLDLNFLALQLRRQLLLLLSPLLGVRRRVGSSLLALGLPLGGLLGGLPHFEKLLVELYLGEDFDFGFFDAVFEPLLGPVLDSGEMVLHEGIPEGVETGGIGLSRDLRGVLELELDVVVDFAHFGYDGGVVEVAHYAKDLLLISILSGNGSGGATYIAEAT